MRGPAHRFVSVSLRAAVTGLAQSDHSGSRGHRLPSPAPSRPGAWHGDRSLSSNSHLRLKPLGKRKQGRVQSCASIRPLNLLLVREAGHR